MRLIDADALIPNISVKAVFGNDVTTMKCGELRTILEMIENAPTIEPRCIVFFAHDIIRINNFFIFVGH